MVAVASGAEPTSRVVCETSAVLVARHPAKRPRAPHWDARLAWRQRTGRAGWSAFDVGFAASLIAIFLLNLLDITVTLMHTGRVGWVAEANGLIRFMAESGGAWLAVVFKLLVVGGAMAILWRLYRQTARSLVTARNDSESRRARLVLVTEIVATGFLAVLYIWVVQHNLRIVWA